MCTESGQGRWRKPAVGLSVLFALTLVHGGLAQAEPRIIPVTVTDEQGRVVSGLTRERFLVNLDGVPTQILGFAGIDSPISIAVVSDEPMPWAKPLATERDELFEVRSVSEAVAHLRASKNVRRTIILTKPTSVREIPDDIRVLQTNPECGSSVALQLRDRYLLAVNAPLAEGIEVLLETPVFLPRMKITWEAGL